jgi:hypothetical protein
MRNQFKMNVWTGIIESPHRALRDATLTFRDFLLMYSNGITTSTTVGHTTGNITDYMVYALWSSCSFYL